MTKKETRTRVYCGPSVRGVARQYTCFTGELPEQMKKFVEQHPMAEGLIVPYDKVAQTRANMEQPALPGQPKTAERIILNSSEQSCKEEEQWHIVMAYM